MGKIVKYENKIKVHISKLRFSDFQIDEPKILGQISSMAKIQYLAKSVHKNLLNKGLVLRDLSSIKKLENCLRFTIGLKDDNNQVIEEIVKLNNY